MLLIKMLQILRMTESSCRKLYTDGTLNLKCSNYSKIKCCKAKNFEGPWSYDYLLTTENQGHSMNFVMFCSKTNNLKHSQIIQGSKINVKTFLELF